MSTPAQSDYELDALRGQPGQVVYGTNNKGVASAVVVNGEPVYEIDAERGGRPALYAPVVQGEVDTASYNPELYEDFRSGLKNGRNARAMKDKIANNAGKPPTKKQGTTSSLEL